MPKLIYTWNEQTNVETWHQWTSLAWCRHWNGRDVSLYINTSHRDIKDIRQFLVTNQQRGGYFLPAIRSLDNVSLAGATPHCARYLVRSQLRRRSSGPWTEDQRRTNDAAKNLFPIGPKNLSNIGSTEAFGKSCGWYSLRIWTWDSNIDHKSIINKIIMDVTDYDDPRVGSHIKVNVAAAIEICCLSSSPEFLLSLSVYKNHMEPICFSCFQNQKGVEPKLR